MTAKKAMLEDFVFWNKVEVGEVVRGRRLLWPPLGICPPVPHTHPPPLPCWNGVKWGETEKRGVWQCFSQQRICSTKNITLSSPPTFPPISTFLDTINLQFFIFLRWQLRTKIIFDGEDNFFGADPKLSDDWMIRKRQHPLTVHQSPTLSSPD